MAQAPMLERSNNAPADATAEEELRPSPAQEELLTTLAAKALMDHLRNRHQLFGPPPADFGALDAEEAELLLRAMVAAAQADGRIDSQEKDHIRDALRLLGLDKDRRGLLAEALSRPTPLDDLLRTVRGPHVASRFYAASVLVLDKHLAVNRAYLAYLALRLQLPSDVVDQVHRQFGYGD